ncbi:conserved hypothetical protein [Planktothrix rubescens CCAP 1459/22]|uniref:Uncharacterized protein n=1 Tax=Planktothrix rubescens CCAP 1459/22 TaxID=329571 RepID=A0A6J7ZRT8_PLARU|nr:conserved hypothetical protein [Planktothrix rubescens NIVA-CYA 18]CAD5963370.1 hypothetical protein PCC7821_03305 [Planktothrix rubescens NIVA-CYA 18]
MNAVTFPAQYPYSLEQLLDRDLGCPKNLLNNKIKNYVNY